MTDKTHVEAILAEGFQAYAIRVIRATLEAVLDGIEGDWSSGRVKERISELLGIRLSVSDLHPFAVALMNAIHDLETNTPARRCSDCSAKGALDAIAQICGCPSWDYPGQVVRDAQSLATSACAATAERERWRHKARQLGLMLATMRTRERAACADRDYYKRKVRDLTWQIEHAGCAASSYCETTRECDATKPCGLCRLRNESDDARRDAELRSEQIAAIASQLKRAPTVSHADRGDPRWTPALYSAWAAVTKHREDAEQIVALLGAKRRVEHALDQNGCECPCTHGPHDHEDDCKRCLACRIEAAFDGGTLHNEGT